MIFWGPILGHHSVCRCPSTWSTDYKVGKYFFQTLCNEFLIFPWSDTFITKQLWNLMSTFVTSRVNVLDDPFHEGKLVFFCQQPYPVWCNAIHPELNYWLYSKGLWQHSDTGPRAGRDCWQGMHISGLMQDCSISVSQSWTEPAPCYPSLPILQNSAGWLQWHAASFPLLLTYSITQCLAVYMLEQPKCI